MAKSADAFRTISEVADWLGVQSHVLRFWESKFTQVKPVKRAGGRRYYRPTDMLLLGGIRKLLHDDGLTIKGVQKILREEGIAHVADMSPALDDDTTAKLDSDLAAHVGDDIEMPEVREDAPASLDQSPFQTQPDDATSAPDATAEPAEPATPLPSFMRGPDPAPVHQPKERVEDIPTLTPDFGPFDDPPSEPDTVDAPPPQDPPAETIRASEPPSDPEIWYDTAKSDQTPPEPRADHDVPPGPFAEPDADPAPEQDSLPMFARTPAAEPEPEPEAEAAPTPRPRIVDAPDEVDVAPDEIGPSALSKAIMLRNLTPAQRDALRPLVAQLTALRDQMARARHDPR